MDRKLIRPQTMEQALKEREKYGRDALPIAGGQSLLVLLRNKLIDPKFLIDLQTLDELQGMKAQGNGMSVGAMTTIHNLASSRGPKRGADFGSGSLKGRLDSDQKSGNHRRQSLSQ